MYVWVCSDVLGCNWYWPLTCGLLACRPRQWVDGSVHDNTMFVPGHPQAGPYECTGVDSATSENRWFSINCASLPDMKVCMIADSSPTLDPALGSSFSYDIYADASWFSDYMLDDATITDTYGGMQFVTITPTFSPSGDASTPGSYTLSYSGISYAGHIATGTMQFNVYASAGPFSCTLDSDGDSVMDCEDNCPHIANPGQLDGDSDGRGDDCDATASGYASECPQPYLFVEGECLFVLSTASDWASANADCPGGTLASVHSMAALQAAKALCSAAITSSQGSGIHCHMGLFGSNPSITWVDGTLTTFPDPFDPALGTSPWATGLDTVNSTAMCGYYKYTVADELGFEPCSSGANLHGVCSIVGDVTVTVLGADPFTLQQGTSFVDPGATATHTWRGSLAVGAPEADDQSNFDAQTLGSYTLVYTATSTAPGDGTVGIGTRMVHVVVNNERCDIDSDGDGVMNCFDNCWHIANPSQLDSDSNGIGNECDAGEFTAGDVPAHICPGDYVYFEGACYYYGTSSCSEGGLLASYHSSDPALLWTLCHASGANGMCEIGSRYSAMSGRYVRLGARLRACAAAGIGH